MQNEHKPESFRMKIESEYRGPVQNYPAKDRIDIGFCLIDNLPRAEVVEWLKSRKNKNFEYIVTPNIDHVQRLYTMGDNEPLVQIYRNAGLSLCDSRILQKIVARTGHGKPQVITGSDLTAVLFSEFLMPHDKIIVIGGDEPVIGKLRSMYPRLQIHHKNPSMGFIHKPSEIDEIVEFCSQIRADYIFLAVGSPRQELVANKLGENLDKGVALCVGASLNFIVGNEKRAPGWVQRMCCEWLFRLLSNPAYLTKRYVNNAIHLPKIFIKIREKHVANKL